MLRVYAACLFVHGANSTFQQTYNSLGEGKKAFFFAFFRKIILLIPLLYLLSEILPWGVLAVMLAEPISDLLTTVANALTSAASAAEAPGGDRNRESEWRHFI